MKKVLEVIGFCLLVLGIGSAATWYIAVVRPWTAYPDEPRESIDERFSSLEKLGWPDGRDLSASVHLASALATVAAGEPAFEALLGRGGGDAVPRLDTAALPDDAIKAIADLLEWHESEGGLPDAPDDETLPVLAIQALAHLALANAPDDPEDARVLAVLHLGEALRQSGETLLESSMGFYLFEEVVEWLKARGLTASKRSLAYVPRRSEIFPLLAREAISAHKHASRALLGGGPKLDRLEERADVPFGTFLSEDRELLVLRKHYADLFQTISPLRDDPKALAAKLTVPPLEDQPKSALVRSITYDMGSVLTHMTRIVDLGQRLCRKDAVPNP